MRALLILLLLLSGCYTSITRFDENVYVQIRNRSVNEILEKNFTPEAYEAIKDIPLVMTDIYSPCLALGSNFWSRAAGLFIGCGVTKKVVVSSRSMSYSNAEETIVHEYIHMLHSMTLNGEGDWINEEEFNKALETCARDTKYKYIAEMCEDYGDRFWTNIFGIDPVAEFIAYAGGHCAFRESPEYLSRVFRKILKNCKNF